MKHFGFYEITILNKSFLLHRKNKKYRKRNSRKLYQKI